MGIFGRIRAQRDEFPIGADHDFGPGAMEPGRAYWITYECRDIGYGVEADYAEFIYRGGPDWTGKHEFEPVGGEPTIYLFPDEIKDAY